MERRVLPPHEGSGGSGTSGPGLAYDRRSFLARAGLLGAVVGAGGLFPRSALAQGDPLDDVVNLLNPVLQQLGRDTWNGVATFVVPGPDAYSRSQGTPREEPGGMEAELPDFLIAALDDFVPFPQEIARPVTAAVASGLSDSGAVPHGLADLLPGEVARLDEALKRLIDTDATIPLSVAVALLLNLLATQVDPVSVRGPFLSPFARLSFEDKAKAFELLERTDSDLVGLLDTEFPEPLKGSVTGLLKFVGGALLEFSAFGGYSEYAVFDPKSKTLTGTPVGWTVSGFSPPEGQNGFADVIGYYQGRKEVHD